MTWQHKTNAQLAAEADAHVALIRQGPPPPTTVTYTPTSVYSPRFGELVGTEVWNGRQMLALPLGTLLVDEYGTSYRVAGTEDAKVLHVTLKESQKTTSYLLDKYLSYSNPRVVVWHP